MGEGGEDVSLFREQDRLVFLVSWVVWLEEEKG